MNMDELAKLLTEQNKALTENWAEQISTLCEAFQKSHVTPTFPGNNSVPMPTFSGDADEDVNEFLVNFNRTSAFYNFTPEKKAEALPLFLTGNASIWFNTTPELQDRSFDVLSKALKKQFHSDSDIWLLRQQLHETKQLATESVSNFAAKIRRLCQRINLPRPERVNYFIQGLRPHIKNYVLLQRPDTFEVAEMHAKHKEALPEQETTDRTDEILRSLAELQKSADDKLTPSVAAFGNYQSSTSQGEFFNHDTFPDKSELENMIRQSIRQELRRSYNSHFSGQIQRGRRSICDFCGRTGHIMATCYRRQEQDRSPSIPVSNRTLQDRDNWEPTRLCPDIPYQQDQQHLNCVRRNRARNPNTDHRRVTRQRIKTPDSTKFASSEITFPSIPAIDACEIEQQTPPKFYAVRSQQLANRIKLRKGRQDKENCQPKPLFRNESQSNESPPTSNSPVITKPDRFNFSTKDATNGSSRPHSTAINSIFVPQKICFLSDIKDANVVDPVNEYKLRNRSVYDKSHEFSKAEEEKILKEDDTEVLEFDEAQSSANISVIDPIRIDVHPAQVISKQEIQNEGTNMKNEFCVVDASEAREITFEIVTLQDGQIVIDNSQIVFEEPYISCGEVKTGTTVAKIVAGNPESATKSFSEDRRQQYRSQMPNDLRAYCGWFIFMTSFCLLMKYIFNLVGKPREENRQPSYNETARNCTNLNGRSEVKSDFTYHSGHIPKSLIPVTDGGAPLKTLEETQACLRDSETTFHVVKGNYWKEIPPQLTCLPGFSVIAYMGTLSKLVRSNPIIFFRNTVDLVLKQFPPPYSYKIPRRRKPPDENSNGESSLA
ncbi:hypothetical protein ACROYT_G036058 [Oculina patagonica]